MHRFSSLIIVLTLWLAGLCAAVQFAKVGLTLPELSALYPDSSSALGFLVSSISFIGALLGLTAGALAVNIGLRKLLLVGLVLGSVISILQSIGLPIGLLLASRVIEGIAHLAIVVTAPTLIAVNSSDRYRPSAMTLWSSFFSVAFALTAWFGLPLVASHGLNALFFIHGALMGATALLVLLVVPKTQEKSTNTESNSIAAIPFIQRHRKAWSSPFVAAPAAGWLFYTITFVALLAVIPALMHPDERNMTATLLPIASILSSMTIGVLLLQWLSAVRVVQVGFIAAIILALVILIVADKPWPAIALFAALGIVQGASFASVPQLNKNSGDQALANGALAQAGNIGNALGTPLLLALLSVGGLTSVVAAVVLCYGIAIYLHSFLAKRRLAQARRE